MPKQTDIIKNHLEHIGALTSAQAMNEYGIMRLASRINDLKRTGYPVQSRIVTGINRLGETCHYAEYFFAGKEERA